MTSVPNFVKLKSICSSLINISAHFWSCQNPVVISPQEKNLPFSVYSMVQFLSFLSVGNCDNCTVSKQERDLSREAFLLMACIHSCKGRWGLNMPIDILRGSRVSCSKLKLGNILVSFKSNLSDFGVIFCGISFLLFSSCTLRFVY
jgi:hypothetical protein